MRITVRSHGFGYKVFSIQDGKGNMVQEPTYEDINKPTTVKRKCPECKQFETKEGHDPCIANSPGVRFACCGHGKYEGYIMFNNGTIFKGKLIVTIFKIFSQLKKRINYE